MHRRAVLKGLFAASIPAVGAAGALAAHAASQTRNAADASIASLRKQVDALSKRLDETDARTRKLTKVAIALAGLSLGLDVTALF
jgi:uncharacterized protein YceH (UPF0502 family)